MIEDLSYSGIVNQIQEDTNTASDMLVEIAEQKELVDLSIQNLKNDLARLERQRGQLKEGAYHILKHLEKHTPLVVQREGFIVVVTDVNISIERNVI